MMTREDIDRVRGEVVEADVYGIRRLKLVPDVVLDLGANVGCFTEYARQMFPQAMIVAVEPNPDNFYSLRTTFMDKPGFVLINQAIGRGPIYRSRSAKNGAMECYLSPGLGYPAPAMMQDDRLESVDVGTVMPNELVFNFVKPGQTFLVKMDIEGAEAAVFNHGPSIDALKHADYIAAEIHKYAITGDLQAEVNRKTEMILLEFTATHDCEQEHVIWRATKRA